MTQNPTAHEPALLPQEAAMLPAMGACRCPGRLMMPGNPADFRPVPAAEAATPRSPGRVNLIQPRREADFRTVKAPPAACPKPQRRSAAGRAILFAAGVLRPCPDTPRHGSGCRRIRIYDGTQERYLNP